MKKLFIHGLAAALLLAGLTACGATNDAVDNTEAVMAEPTGAADSSGQDDDAAVSSAIDVMDAFVSAITAETATEMGICGDDLTWYYKDNVLVIKGAGPMTDYSNNFEDGHSTAPWCDGGESGLYEQIYWVIIDEGVVSIGECAFAECSGLSKVVLPDTLQDIGSFAFYDCTSLFNMELPGTLQSIGGSAFRGSQLAELTVPESVTYIGHFALGGADNVVITFLGEMPDTPIREDSGLPVNIFEGYVTVKYSGSSFDEYIAVYPDINWVKQ